jgi:biopolymer transport protein ExbB/TolQ
MTFSVLELWQNVGFTGRAVVFALLGLSLVSLAIGIERLLVVRRARRLSALFLAAWRDAEERPWGNAVDVPPGRGDESPAAVLLRSLGEVLDRGMPREVAERAYDRTMRRILLGLGASLRRGLGFLAAVGSTAPFIGLFGTVMGIVNAFQQMALTGQGGLATVAGGIAEALVTTALGIFAAIPALWLYNAITGAADRLLTELECAAEELASEHLASEFSEQRSHSAARARRASIARQER